MVLVGGTTVNRWFVRRRGWATVMRSLSQPFMLGFPAVVSATITRIGWRSMCVGVSCDVRIASRYSTAIRPGARAWQGVISVYVYMRLADVAAPPVAVAAALVGSSSFLDNCENLRRCRPLRIM